MDENERAKAAVAEKAVREFVHDVSVVIGRACADFTGKTGRYIDGMSVEFIPHGLAEYSQCYSLGLITPHVAEYREADLRTFG